MSDHRYTGRCRCGQVLSFISSVEKNGLQVGCPSCGKYPWLKRVQGEFNPDHKCDIRCTSAKGNVCSCACGGANHGRDHGGTHVVAVTGRTLSGNRENYPAREAQCLGEVGKHITGEVTLRTRRPIANDRFYFRFTTNGNHDRIDWFVPDQYAPDWQEGWTGKIRAKVTKHVDHPQYGKSTTVIFVEEVV